MVYVVKYMLDMTILTRRNNGTKIGSVQFKIGIQRGNSNGRLDTMNLQ